MDLALSEEQEMLKKTAQDFLGTKCPKTLVREMKKSGRASRLYNSNLSLDPTELNHELTEWLIEYNFNRPHQSLGYLAPIEYIERELAKISSPVLPIWSATTVIRTMKDDSR